MDTRSFLVPAELTTPRWPSGRGREIGAIVGTFASIAAELSRPFFYDREYVTTFILSKDIGLIVISLEMFSTDGRASLLEAGSEKLSERTFFAIYVASSISVDVAEPIVRSYFAKDTLVDFHY